jgi:hypothetical protein
MFVLLHGKHQLVWFNVRNINTELLLYLMNETVVLRAVFTEKVDGSGIDVFSHKVFHSV